MQDRRVVWILAAVVLAAAAGCEKPPVEIAVRHELPPAVPLPAGAESLTAGAFEVRGDAGPELGEFVRQELGACLGGGSAARVDGMIRATTTDTRTVREVLRPEPGGADLQPVELPSLQRKAEVRIAFEVRAGEGKPFVTIETEAAYDSVADAGARGELGLQRPDDPANVPPPAEIFRRLAAQCVEQFCGMIQPVLAEATLALRPLADPRMRQALAAVRDERFEAARGVFRQIAADRPQDAAAWFDLAVLEERTGELAAAEQHYGRVVDMTHGADRQALQGRQRVHRVLAVRGPGAAEEPGQD